MVLGYVQYFKRRMGDRVEGTHEMLCIFFDNDTAGKHRCVCAGFLFSDRECMLGSFHASYSACCLMVPPLIFSPCTLNPAADLPQESSCSVGVFGKGADVRDSLKESFRSWKGFGQGAFAFGTGRLGFRVPPKYHHLKKMVAIPAFVFNGRHFMQPL
jgi:hypothetical protein